MLEIIAITALALLAPTPSLAEAATTAASGVAAALPFPSSTSTAGLAGLIKPFTPDALASGFATLVGALLGAMLAYALQRRFQRSQEFKSDLVSAHRLMFALLQQINTVVLIQRDYVFAELNNPGRFLSIPAMLPRNTQKNVLELQELAFLLASKEGRAILYDFYLAQENYIEALNQWNLRSAYHLEKIQPAMAEAGFFGSTATITEVDLQKTFGAHHLGAIVNATNNSIESLKRAFERLAAVKKQTRPYLVKRFRTDDFTDFDFPDTYGLTQPETKPGA